MSDERERSSGELDVEEALERFSRLVYQLGGSRRQLHIPEAACHKRPSRDECGVIDHPRQAPLRVGLCEICRRWASQQHDPSSHPGDLD